MRRMRLLTTAVAVTLGIAGLAASEIEETVAGCREKAGGIYYLSVRIFARKQNYSIGFLHLN